MFKSKKISAVAAVLGGFVLLGLGGGPAVAVAVESPAKCSDDGKGNVRCTDTGEQQLTSERYGKVRLVNDVRQSCSGGGADVSCGTSVVVDGKKV